MFVFVHVSIFNQSSPKPPKSTKVSPKSTKVRTLVGRGRVLGWKSLKNPTCYKIVQPLVGTLVGLWWTSVENASRHPPDTFSTKVHQSLPKSTKFLPTSPPNSEKPYKPLRFSMIFTPKLAPPTKSHQSPNFGGRWWTLVDFGGFFC